MSETLTNPQVQPEHIKEQNEAIEQRIHELRKELAELEAEAFRRDSWGLNDTSADTQTDLEAYFAARDYKDENGALHDAVTGKFKSEKANEELPQERIDTLSRMTLKELIEEASIAHSEGAEHVKAAIEDAIVDKLAQYAEKYNWSSEAQSQHLEHVIDQINGNTAAQAIEDLEFAKDEDAKSDFVAGSYIIWNGELYQIEAVGDLTDQGDRFVRLKLAYGNNPQPVDTFERTLVEAGATDAPEAELQRLDFNNGMDAIVANVIGGVMTIEEAKEAVRALGKQTNQPDSIVDNVVLGLPALVAMEPSDRATLGDYDDIFVPNTSGTTTPTAGKTLGERLREARQRPLVSEDDTDLPADKSVMDKIKDAQLQAVANAQAALNVASEKARSNNHERKNSRKWIIAAAGIGALAVALFVGSKYGFSLKPNAEAAQAAQDAADTAGKQVEKLTRVQQALISAPGKYPYGHYEHVFGADAAEQLHKAVRRLHAAGVKVIEHGSGRDYWIEVPTKNGAGMTANTKRVVEVLATGRV